MRNLKYFTVKDEANKRNLYRYLKSREFPFTVIIKPYEKIRSIKKNAYLWVLYQHVSDHTGYSIEELHSEFKGMFLTDLEINNLEIVIKSKSTSELSNWIFNQYCEKIRIFVLTELNLLLPMPHEILTDNLVFESIYKYY